jgi:hypothetical protein
MKSEIPFKKEFVNMDERRGTIEPNSTCTVDNLWNGYGNQQ